MFEARGPQSGIHPAKAKERLWNAVVWKAIRLLQMHGPVDEGQAFFIAVSALHSNFVHEEHFEKLTKFVEDMEAAFAPSNNANTPAEVAL